MLTGSLATRGETTFFGNYARAPASVSRWSDPHWQELQRLVLFFLSFSTTKWSAFACYGGQDEQCSTPRARGWGGIITNVVVLKKSVKRCGCFQKQCSRPRARLVLGQRVFQGDPQIWKKKMKSLLEHNCWTEPGRSLKNMSSEPCHQEEKAWLAPPWNLGMVLQFSMEIHRRNWPVERMPKSSRQRKQAKCLKTPAKGEKQTWEFPRVANEPVTLLICVMFAKSCHRSHMGCCSWLSNVSSDVSDTFPEQKWPTL